MTEGLSFQRNGPAGLFCRHRHQSGNGFAIHKNGLVMIIGKEDADHVRVSSSVRCNTVDG